MPQLHPFSPQHQAVVRLESEGYSFQAWRRRQAVMTRPVDGRDDVRELVTLVSIDGMVRHLGERRVQADG